MTEKKQLTRRDFMGMTTWAISGVIGLGLGIPAVVYVISPTRKGDENQD